MFATVTNLHNTTGHYTNDVKARSVGMTRQSLNVIVAEPLVP